jgi:hypothetical protein
LGSGRGMCNGKEVTKDVGQGLPLKMRGVLQLFKGMTSPSV